MGMYTELVFKASLINDVPAEVMAVIDYLFGDGGSDRPEQLPDHPFFNKPRWSCIGRCSSFYHHPSTLNSVYKESSGGPYIFSRSDLKNYDGEIAAFLDWIDPYIYGSVGECIGWSWYEEAEKPTLIYKGGRPY